MKNKYIALGAVAIVGVLGAFAISQGALAYRGNPDQTGPNYSPERHAEMQKAFDSNDYNAWKEQMNGRGRATQVVNEQNFSRFVEMRKLMLEKNMTKPTRSEKSSDWVKARPGGKECIKDAMGQISLTKTATESATTGNRNKSKDKKKRGAPLFFVLK